MQDKINNANDRYTMARSGYDHDMSKLKERKSEVDRLRKAGRQNLANSFCPKIALDEESLMLRYEGLHRMRTEISLLQRMSARREKT